MKNEWNLVKSPLFLKMFNTVGLNTQFQEINPPTNPILMTAFCSCNRLYIN